jgi:hypothetical protein
MAGQVHEPRRLPLIGSIGCTLGRDQRAHVTAVEAQSLGVGVGVLGQVARLKISYDRSEPGAPATAIVKMPTLDPGGREICRIFQFYEREIRFYEEIASKISMRVPRCSATAMDTQADDYLILLEEMTDVTVGDEVAGRTRGRRAIRAGAVPRDMVESPTSRSSRGCPRSTRPCSNPPSSRTTRRCRTTSRCSATACRLRCAA